MAETPVLATIYMVAEVDCCPRCRGELPTPPGTNGKQACEWCELVLDYARVSCFTDDAGDE